MQDSCKRYMINYSVDVGDGKKYKGQYKSDVHGKLVKDGLGTLIWQDGAKYEGQFANDMMSGTGRMT